MKKIIFPASLQSAFFMVFLLLSVYGLQAQNPYTIQFQDEIVIIPENIDQFQWQQMPESSKFDNGYYGWIQFYETPTQEIQDRFKAQGLQLNEYIPHKTYAFYFPETTSISFLRENNVRGIIPVEGRLKLAAEMKNPPYEAYAMEGNRILVMLQFHPQITADQVIKDLTARQIAVKQQYRGAQVIDLSIPDNCLEDLASLPYVKWIELITPPDVKDDTRGRSLHRSAGLDTQLSAGRNYTGEGIGVLVRDDGIVGPHIDFQGRIDNSGASGTGQTHGDGVAGIMAGAGNLDPDMRGMAAGSNVYVSNYESNFLDATTQNLINNGDVQITNSSYSNGCNDGYTIITQRVDTQTNTIPSLLHVFSAGNSNGSNCGYGAGNQWGNITGGHKQGKNVIATANVFFDGSLVNSSSRGPAHDGRIKPDITANGQNQNSTDENNEYMSFGGTSGAAPGIAGVSAQLYQLYAEDNGGDLPPSALIKAALLNTANEAGNIGPDYKFGWGIVNGLRAGLLLEEERYLNATVTQGNANTHTIAVPAATKQVRFMVYWSDPAATSGANPALVNDLDLVVTDPSANTYLPWILNPAPNPTTLNLPATLGADHLNNMEQVVLNNPGAGDYTINISGFNVPVGPQQYFVVYEIISENLTVTYPNAGEHFVPGQTESIHWDAVNTTSNFDLEYSTDNGSSWNAIASVSNTTTNYGWVVPAGVTGEALIRITNGDATDVSDAPFSIAPRPTNLQVVQVCPTAATFSWNAVAGANSYDLYVLGATTMEVAGTSATTSVTVPITNPNDPIWAAVVAKNTTDGWESKRTIAINHNGGLLNCSLANDLSVLTINNDASDFALVCAGSSDVVISATFMNTGVDVQSGFTVSYQLNNQPVVSETIAASLNSGEQISHDFATPATFTTSGSYSLVVSITLTGDENGSNDSSTLDFYASTEATSLDFEETFDVNGVPPNGWEVINVDASNTWEERSGIIGSNEISTTAAYLNNFDYNAAGEEDILQTEIFDLTNAEIPSLTFDLAKAQYSSGFSDGLRVEISTDCGATYTSIYQKEGLDLSTLPGYNTSNWFPSSESNWRTETIDLIPYEGENVQFRFINITGFGNSTFIDNINVSAETLGVAKNDLDGITLYPNPASNEVFLQLDATFNDRVHIELVNNLGQTLVQLKETAYNGQNTLVLDVSEYASGMYFVIIKSEGRSITKKLVVH